MLLAHARVLTATLWVGSLWGVGFLVAPTLFATVADRALAGTIAGRLFQAEAWLSVFCAVALVVLLRAGANDKDGTIRKHLLWLTAGMLLCTLIGYFGLQPFMQTLREAAGPGGVMASETKMQFGILHGASMVFYLIQSLLGVALVLKIR
jgi:hypothetical protein